MRSLGEGRPHFPHNAYFHPSQSLSTIKNSGHKKKGLFLMRDWFGRILMLCLAFLLTVAGVLKLPSTTPSPAAAQDDPTPTASPTDDPLPDLSLSDTHDPAATLAELYTLGLIPEGGRLVYENPDNYFVFGEGGWYILLTESHPHTNFVFATDLSFQSSAYNPEEREICSIESRLELDPFLEPMGTFLRVGLSRGPNLYLYNLFDQTANNRDDEAGFTRIEFELEAFELDSVHRLLIAAYDTDVYVFLDNQLMLHYPDALPMRGSYALTMFGEGTESRCEASNFWIWELDSAWDQDAGVCGITSLNEVNKRNGPGTEFDSGGKLFSGLTQAVDGQAVGSDGKTWWRLADGSWVREDVVEEVGDCSLAPVVQ